MDGGGAEVSDSDFTDVGDELVVRISGYPVGKARVEKIFSDYLIASFGVPGKPLIYFELPLNVKDYDTVDGVAHGQP